VAAYFLSARTYFSELFYLRPHTLVGRHVVLLFVLLFVIAALSRRRYLWFLAWFAILAPLPVLFIPPRGFFVMYLPVAGWAMFVAGALVCGRDRLFAGSPDPISKDIVDRRNRQIARLAPLAVCLCAFAYGLADPEFQMRAAAADPMSQIIDLSKQDFMRLNEPVPEGGSILMMGSRFPADSNPYFPLMVVQLLYRDRKLQLDRVELMNPPPGPAAFPQYDRVIAFDGVSLSVVMRGGSPDRKVRFPGTDPAWQKQIADSLQQRGQAAAGY
jgi:hypothetical protein